MFNQDFWLGVSRVSLYFFILFSLWRAWERRTKNRDHKNRDALIRAIVEGHITSVEWGVDPTTNPGGRGAICYCVFKGKGWKFLAREGSQKMKRAPYGFVPHEIRALMLIPNLEEVLASAMFLLRGYGPAYDVWGSEREGWIRVVSRRKLKPLEC